MYRHHKLFLFDMIKEDNIYLLLGLSDRASVAEVRKAFRDFAKKNHPDFFPGNKTKEEKFKDVTATYQNWKLIENAISEIRRIKRLKNGNGYGFKGYEKDYKKWLKKNNYSFRA